MFYLKDLKGENRDLQWTGKVIGADTRSEARLLCWIAQVNLAFMSAFIAAYSSLEDVVKRPVSLSVCVFDVMVITKMI